MQQLKGLIINTGNADPLQPRSIDMRSAVNFGKQSIIPAVFPNHSVQTRKHMRQYLANAHPAAEKLQKVIDDFVHAVMNAPLHIEYKTIFDHYHDLWFKECSKLKKIKHVAIDTHYFANEYKPKV